MSFLSKLALTVGAAASLAVAASPAMARPYFGGGGFGYHGYHGYRHDNSGAFLAGALAIGGIAAIAASSHRHDYYDGYRGDAYYRGPGYYSPPPPPPPPAYEGGYYAPQPQGYYGSPYGYEGRWAPGY